DVASFGDAFATTSGASVVTFDDPVANVYKRVVVGPKPTRGPRPVLGGVLVGDASMYQTLVAMARGDMPPPERVDQLLVPAAGDGDGAPTTGVGALAPTALVCTCNSVTKADICAAIAKGDAPDVGAIKRCTKAGTGCGGCVPLVTELFKHQQRAAGVEVRNDL